MTSKNDKPTEATPNDGVAAAPCASHCSSRAVDAMVDELHQLMTDHCFEQAQELAEDIDADERSTPEQRTTAGECLRQIMRNEEAYSWGYDQ